MKKPVPPQPAKFPAAKQRRMDQLLDKNREGTITPAEKVKLVVLVAEAERLMVDNLRQLEEFSRKEQVQAPAGAVPVTVWVAPQPMERWAMGLAAGYRRLVAARAGGSCEYCRLLQAATGVTFHLEHIIPRSEGGLTVLANLAFSCPGCNLAKSQRTSGKDNHGQIHPLFNPREFEPWLLGWHLHFVLERSSGLIVPRTPIGQATANSLNVNDSLRLFARKLQIAAGLMA
jgi:hypothetical protein